MISSLFNKSRFSWPINMSNKSSSSSFLSPHEQTWVANHNQTYSQAAYGCSNLVTDLNESTPIMHDQQPIIPGKHHDIDLLPTRSTPSSTGDLHQQDVDYDTDDCSLGSLGDINQCNKDFILRPPQEVFSNVGSRKIHSPWLLSSVRPKSRHAEMTCSTVGRPPRVFLKPRIQINNSYSWAWYHWCFCIQYNYWQGRRCPFSRSSYDSVYGSCIYIHHS